MSALSFDLISELGGLSGDAGDGVASCAGSGGRLPGRGSHQGDLRGGVGAGQPAAGRCF